jgi:pimeloyl-ACP methyl ester carboxylesterase
VFEILKKKWIYEQNSKYNIRFGPSTLDPSGSLENWTIIPRLHQINAKTLLIRGSEEYVQEAAMQPFFDRIPKVKWVTFQDAAHFSHIEQKEKFYSQVKYFLET